MKKHIARTDAIDRKGFIRKSLGLIAAFLFLDRDGAKLFAAEEKLQPRKKRNIKTDADLAAATGENPSISTRRAVAALGGMTRFVKRSDVVVIKPNIGWDRAPQYAATTNPDVVEALVRMCVESGARTVKVFDNTCNSAAMCYRNSGIEEAVKRAGGSVIKMAKWKYLPGNFPPGSPMEDWPVYRDAVECDCFINVPVAKHHSLTGLTLSIKNLMGACGGTRGMMHLGIDKKLVALAGFINPDLTVIDAYRVLLRHGPSGGSMDDVELKKTVIASRDPVLADAYAAKLMKRNPGEIGHIRLGSENGLGSMDLSSARIKKINA